MLRVENIWKSYNNQPLLQGISFALGAEETICLLGASGSGKSTLMRIIAGLESAESGRILWDGSVIDDVPVHKRGFGFMFQDYALFPDKSVEENVAFGLRMQGVPEAQRRERVSQALDLVEMNGFQSRRVTNLSGGEQQRVALARALAPEPRLLMLDEPLAALDRALREQLVRDLKHILDRAQIAAIYVTHDQEEAYQVSDRIMLIHEGRIEQAGKPDVVYNDPASPWVAEFLGMKNNISGVVRSVQPLRVETPYGLLTVDRTPAVPVNAGDRLELFLPEKAIRIANEGETENLLEGEVTESAFQATGYMIELRLAADKYVSFSSDFAVVVGRRLTIHVDPAGLIPFRVG